MLEVYWICLLGGLGVSAAMLFLGDVLGDALHLAHGLDHLVEPVSLVGGVTAFGAAGLLLSHYTALGAASVTALSAVLAVAFALVALFAYVRPMRRSETSTGFSIEEYRGRLGEVITAVPAEGYGEVLVRMGPANTFRTAASFEETPIPSGERVVVVDVRSGVLLVAPFREGSEPAEIEPAAPVRVPERVR
jgi:membrane protein implicated in regulation of membrane protease activity